MKVNAKCHNYSGCVLAYRGENIELDSGAALVCPECGKPLVVQKSGGSWMKTTAILSVAIILLGAGGAFFALKYLKPPKAPKKDDVTVVTPTPPKTDPVDRPNDDPEKPVEPQDPGTSAGPIVAPANIDLDVKSAESQQVKDEVLKRIDVMPNVTKANKDKLYISVERARSMGKVLTIPFNSGGSAISSMDSQTLKDAMESPQVMKLRDDPTAVFVILGYADARGDDKKNLAVSQTRADNVINVMKNKCGIANVMHAVAMGSSKLLDEKNLEKNRIVEVWAVLP